MVLLWRRPSRTTLAWTLAVQFFAFFMLPTQMHQRYLLPAATLAALVAPLSSRGAALFFLLAGTATLNQALDLGRAVLEQALVVDPAAVADPPAWRSAIRIAATAVAVVNVGALRLGDARCSAKETRARVTALRALFALALVPLALGMVVVTYQDAVMTHLPARMAMAAQMKAGEIPFLHPYQSCGQPLAGNPNFGTFFPDTILFLLLPPGAAFGMRFALAALLAFVGARRWARAEGASPPAAEVAGYAFALSGVFVSAWRFYNTGLALALAPFVLAAVARACRPLRAGPRPAPRDRRDRGVVRPRAAGRRAGGRPADGGRGRDPLPAHALGDDGDRRAGARGAGRSSPRPPSPC